MYELLREKLSSMVLITHCLKIIVNKIKVIDNSPEIVKSKLAPCQHQLLMMPPVFTCQELHRPTLPVMLTTNSITQRLLSLQHSYWLRNSTKLRDSLTNPTEWTADLSFIFLQSTGLIFLNIMKMLECYKKHIVKSLLNDSKNGILNSNFDFKKWIKTP